MPFGDFATLQRGHDLPEERRRPGNVPIIGSFGVTGWHDEARAPGPGVTVGRSGASFGVASYSPVDFWPLNTALYVVDFHGNDQRFTYYFMKYFDFRSFNSGSAQPSLNRNFIHPVLIDVPALQEQQAIAHILGTLDDKIELNQRMNETLEAIARALFKSWFVDFDPVRAKAKGRVPCLNKSFADLFPDSFDNSKFEEIPRGWQSQSLRELADFYSGGTPSKRVSEYWNGSIPWISPKSMVSKYVDRSDEYVTASAIDNGTRLARKGAILVMVRGMGLHQGIRIAQAQCDVTFNQDVKALIPKWGDGTFLLFALLDASPYLFSKVQSAGHGTGVLPTDVLETLNFAVPPEPLREQLIKPISDFSSKIVANNNQINTLAALRDTLLPKLISGELRIRDAEKLVGSVP